MKNCWTCKHNTAFGARPTHLCVMDVRRADVDEWTDAVGLDDSLMPPRTADGCPGYAPVAPQARAKSTARIETEADVQNATVGEWDADDEGRDIG